MKLSEFSNMSALDRILRVVLGLALPLCPSHMFR